MMTWFIDALDARAGLAFASFRDADLNSPAPQMDALAVHIAAPDFRSEKVASRALGLAATRSSFQLGVFLQEAELGFQSLDDVIEFVRRAFLSSGGGDGPQGIGGGPPFNPEGPAGGDEGPELGEIYQLAWPVRQLFQALQNAADKATLQNDFALAQIAGTTEPQYAASGFQQDPAPLLAVAVACLAGELIGRCPEPKQTGELAVWCESLRALGAAADRLGLWSALSGGASAGLLTGVGRRFLASKKQILLSDAFAVWLDFDPSTELQGLAVSLCLLNGYDEDDLQYALRVPPEDWVRTAFRRRRLGGFNERGDRFEDLSRFPLPPSVARSLGLETHDSRRLTLSDLLCSAVGAPLSLGDVSPIEAGLLLFAAMHLQCERSPVAAGMPSPLARSWRIALAERSHAWLVQQLPRQAFPLPVEALLAQAPMRRYA